MTIVLVSVFANMAPNPLFGKFGALGKQTKNIIAVRLLYVCTSACWGLLSLSL